MKEIARLYMQYSDGTDAQEKLLEQQAATITGLLHNLSVIEGELVEQGAKFQCAKEHALWISAEEEKARTEVGESKKLLADIHADLLMRAQSGERSDGVTVVDLSNSIWRRLKKAIE